jgi:hypothetical protein
VKLEDLYQANNEEGVDDRDLDVHGGYDSEDNEDLYVEDNDRYHRVI